MKIYHKLTLPKDTAWERKTWRRYFHWKIKYFIDGIHNIIRWIPFLYHDRDWDDHFTLKLLQKKIEHQRKYLVEHNRHTRVDEDNYWMTVVLNLIEREKEEYYSIEHYNYMDLQITFKPSKHREDSYEVERKIKSEHLEDYLNKYKNVVKKVIKLNKGLSFDNADQIASFIASYNQDRCRNLLFEILKRYSNRWWD
jgi:hypothetical protein